MSTQIPITVLMPAYNAALYIKDAIESVLGQTFTNFELLIVNDGSTDQTESIINNIKDGRIRLINQANQGVAAALNTGLALAKGKYIARADADDICMPNRLKIQFDFLEQNSDYVLVASDVDYIDEAGNFVFHFKNTNTGYSNQDIQERFFNYCPFIHSAVMFKTEVIHSVGGYNPLAIAFEDYFLWSKVISQGKVCNLSEVLMKIRLNAASVTVDDRDYPEAFIKAKQKAITSGLISPEDGQILKSSYQQIQKKSRIISYHLLLAKKYLWENYQPQKARENIKAVIKIAPFNKTANLMRLFSYLGEKFIKSTYQKLKK